MSFDLCCDNPLKVNYEVIHDKILDDIKIKLFDIIEYLPEMDSEQSPSNTIFNNLVYDDYLFNLFLNEMNISNDDVLIINKPNKIDESDIGFYLHSICINCQKIIIQKRAKKNKILEIFRHIRNSIAHGHFNIVGDYFISFDKEKDDYNSVIKVKYYNLFNTLGILQKIVNLTDLYCAVLNNIGYEITRNLETDIFGDLFVRKNGIDFCLEFKNYGGRYIKQIDVQNFIDEVRNNKKENIIYVLVVDSTYTNSKINQYVMNENISILDKNFVKEMLEGRDILMELSKFHLQKQNC